MTNVKADISLSKALLEEVETLAQEMKISRDRLFALAVQDFILRYQIQQLVEQPDQAYQGGRDAEEQQQLRYMRRVQRELLADDLSDEEFEALADQLLEETDRMIPPGTPPLSDYALSRESFYEGHPKF